MNWRDQLLADLQARYAELCVREREHVFVEAFCLMTYEGVKPRTPGPRPMWQRGRTPTGESELLWNSRNGVTPFCIRTRDGQGEMQHFGRDQPVPGHRPAAGDRIFVDCKPEDALEHAEKLVAEGWDHPEYPLSRSYDRREDAVRSFAMGTYESGIQPRVVVVTEAMAKKMGWQR